MGNTNHYVIEVDVWVNEDVAEGDEVELVEDIILYAAESVHLDGAKVYVRNTKTLARGL